MIELEDDHSKKYLNLRDGWKIALEKKKLKRERHNLIKESLPEPSEETEKLVVHSPAHGIRYPP
jgi:hypothetical protein